MKTDERVVTPQDLVHRNLRDFLIKAKNNKQNILSELEAKEEKALLSLNKATKASKISRAARKGLPITKKIAI